MSEDMWSIVGFFVGFGIAAICFHYVCKWLGMVPAEGPYGPDAESKAMRETR